MLKKTLWMVALAFTACAQQGKGSLDDDFSGLDEKSDAFSAKLKVVGPIAYGETQSTLYRATPLYQAFTFAGHLGDKITVDVSSSNGDAVAWLLDDKFAIVAQNDDASASTVDSHVETTLPRGGTYYLVLRDYNKQSHYFNVKLGGKAGRVIELYADKCTDRNRFVPAGEIPTVEDLALDAFCGETILGKLAPKGDVVIFGSSRLKDGTPEYALARQFAHDWTLAHADLPIMTGGGPGIMEAGNRGAKEAGGVSLGFSTFFKDANDKLNDYVTDGYLFSDFPVRERALLKYAKAAVVFPGGVGTAWEFFMTMSEVQTGKLKKIPIVMVSSSMNGAVKPYLDWMVAHGTISSNDENLYVVVDTAADAIKIIETALATP